MINSAQSRSLIGFNKNVCFGFLPNKSVSRNRGIMCVGYNIKKKHQAKNKINKTHHFVFDETCKLYDFCDKKDAPAEKFYFY